MNIHPYQEKSLSVSFFALGLDMAIALDIAMAMAKAYHFYRLDNVFVCTLTQVGEYRKIPAFGFGPSTSCWYFPVLPSSRLGAD